MVKMKKASGLFLKIVEIELWFISLLEINAMSGSYTPLKPYDFNKKDRHKIIPILMYHSLSKKNVGNKYIIDEKIFDTQLKYLSNHGFTTLAIDDYHNYLEGLSKSIPEKSIMITFDDGHESDVNIAFPLLKKYGFATI